MAIIGHQERAAREITARAGITNVIYRYAVGAAASDSLFYRRSIRLELALPVRLRSQGGALS